MHISCKHGWYKFITLFVCCEGPCMLTTLWRAWGGSVDAWDFLWSWRQFERLQFYNYVMTKKRLCIQSYVHRSQNWQHMPYFFIFEFNWVLNDIFIINTKVLIFVSPYFCSANVLLGAFLLQLPLRLLYYVLMGALYIWWSS